MMLRSTVVLTPRNSLCRRDASSRSKACQITTAHRSYPVMAARQLFVGSCLALSLCDALADNWSGSIRSKIQTDNRYDLQGDYTGEVWGQFAYVNPEHQLNARFSTLSRFSTDIYREKQEVYQAYLEKQLPDQAWTLRGGRFERSDSLGLYLLDGASANYRFDKLPLTVDLYGGRPVRIDHVRSVEGSLVAGAEGLLKLHPYWSLGHGKAQINDLDWRLGLQVVEDEQTRTQSQTISEQEIVGNIFDAVEGQSGGETQTHTQRSYRLSTSTRLAGHLLAPDKPTEWFLQGSYAADKNRLENVLLDGWWDPWRRLRLRNYVEAYRPREPFVTFRDRFYSAYALGEQRVWRGSAQFKHDERLSYSAGLQVAGRDRGYSGSGFNVGVSYQWQPALTLRGEFDTLQLDSGEYAHSLYASASHALTSKTRYTLNLAFREEDKALYGKNQARGIENEWQHMLDNSLVLGFKGSFINNSALPNEYLAAMQLTYYFDRFQPKKP